MHEVKPKAEILDFATHHQDNLVKIYAGYRRCYSDLEGRADIALPSTREAFIRKMLKAEHAHESPLEHGSLTFHITCSRACSHQLVRHRIASYSQQSQRYVQMKDMPVIVPPSIAASEEAKEDFMYMMQECENAYHRMAQLDAIAFEDARFALPASVATHILVTMNFRSLLHFFAERTCNRAQWEIRSLAEQMLAQCKEWYPCVFENAGPHCMKLKRCPEAKPCGKQPWKKES